MGLSVLASFYLDVITVEFVESCSHINQENIFHSAVEKVKDFHRSNMTGYMACFQVSISEGKSVLMIFQGNVFFQEKCSDLKSKKKEKKVKRASFLFPCDWIMKVFFDCGKYIWLVRVKKMFQTLGKGENTT